MHSDNTGDLLNPKPFLEPKKFFRLPVRVAMAKNRNKKKNGLAAMDISTEQTVTDTQAMDTSESAPPKPHIGGSHKKMKGVQMKRTKNVRKMKAIAKAISKSEKLEERITRSESKIERTKSAKKLYE